MVACALIAVPSPLSPDPPVRGAREIQETSRHGEGREILVKVTYYGPTGRKTASGTIPKEGRTIGVDPKVIPLGSKVLMNGKIYVAEDTGKKVKGLIIDQYTDTPESETYKLGVKYERVMIVDQARSLAE
jgi:3D (Asp-Asp-Asp) domain-containing protein